jgi:hypothetical protein
MPNILVGLIVPYTFCDEGEYKVRVWHDTTIKIKHVQNKEGVQTAKGIHIHGSPQMIPDDPFGLYFISQVELSFPPPGGESPSDLSTNDYLLSY